MGRGAYQRRKTEDDKKHVVDRIRSSESWEYTTARKLGLACDDFLKSRSIQTINRWKNDNRPRPQHPTE